MAEPLAAEPAPSSVFRRAMGAFATGVAVLTTEFDGLLHGMTVNSLTSVSLDPSTVLVCLRAGSTTGMAVRLRRNFGLNILSCQQRSLSRQFCGPLEARFKDVELLRDETGIPLIVGAVAHIRCSLQEVHASGDHEIFFGEVEHCGSIDGQPLVFLGGRLGTFTDEENGGNNGSPA
jgi:3-hydroxy-9,10-secoandrosta-1,3,5(10)-triene-9,17-dione monooxygenase reductase component